MSLENLVNIEVNYESIGKEYEMKKGWIFMSAQYNSAPLGKFLDGMEYIAKKFKDYEIGVLPMAPAPYEKEIKMHDRLQDYVMYGTHKINNSLEVRDMKVKPQAVKPLTGIRRSIKKNKSTIFASPKQSFEHMPTLKDIPKLIATTGAVTKPHYNMNTMSGQKAFDMHEYGAIVVEVIDDNYFSWRSIKANKNGSFDDYKFGHWDGKQLRKPRRPFVNIGDGHYIHAHDGAHNWTVGIIKQTKPIGIVDHDIADMGCISHHNKGKTLGKYWARKDMTLDKEFTTIVKYMKEIHKALPKGAKYVVPQANHNEHLGQWVNEGRYVDDAENIQHVPSLLQYMLNGQNPLEQTLKKSYGLPKTIKFLTRNEEYKVYGIDFSQHFDLGASGTRFSVNHAINHLGNASGGHGHTAYKHEGITTAGTRTKKRIGYNKGFSPWSHSIVLGYPNANTQTLNYIGK